MDSSILGRQSYKSFNKEIEKLKPSVPIVHETSASISDTEMTEVLGNKRKIVLKESQRIKGSDLDSGSLESKAKNDNMEINGNIKKMKRTKEGMSKEPEENGSTIDSHEIIPLTNIEAGATCLISTIKATGGSAIKNIQISPQGRDLVINYERVIKSFTIRIDDLMVNLDPQNQFKDLVEPIQWVNCGFSHNGDYVIAASAQKHTHEVYIFDKNAPHIIRKLEEPKGEGVADFVWHPSMPTVVSISRFGVVFIWSIEYQENWSAFTP
ncbi:hypothetical protein HK096_009955, partial [Nowakowskiella sp. JEL0078]